MAANVTRTEEVCDVLEPNDDISRAVPIWDALGRDDLAICPADDRDFFLAEAYPGQRILITAAGISGQAELSLTAMRSDGRIVSASAGINPGIALFGDNEGIFFVEVTGVNGQDSVPYRLFWQEY
jgi:hypothetical protein